MMENCVQYALTAEEITQVLYGFAPNAAKVRSIMNGPRWEVWQGLPLAYGFSEKPCRNGKIGWLAAPKSVNIWVTPDTYEALESAPNMQEVVLMVFCEEDPEKRRRCDVLLADKEGGLNQAIARARQLNANIITRPK